MGRLPKDEHPKLAQAFVDQSFQKGATIIKQGDSGHEFFVIREGEASVHVDGNKVTTLKKGDYFGEASLLRDEVRNATIQAETVLEAFKITGEKFQEFGLTD